MTEFEQQVERFRQTVKNAEGWSQAAQSIYGEIAAQLEDAVTLLEDAQRMLEREKKALETAERNKERFRYALWVYLQERDGVAGIRAPAPQTLKLIRELVHDLGEAGGQ